MPRAGKTPHDDLLVSTHTQLGLLCAANLAFRHIPFQFGGTAEPDLTWNLGTGAQGSLEIHRGAFGLSRNADRALQLPRADLLRLVSHLCADWLRPGLRNT